MKNIILIAILIFIVGSILFYLFKAKKQGQTCIGCPYAKECGKKGCKSSK
jgi:hypothetical protein